MNTAADYLVARGSFTAADLRDVEFADPRWAVDGLIPEGLTLFVGRPKIGKSFLALNVAIAVASGGYALGHVPVELGDVLYLALEDTPRRLQTRLQTMLQGAEWPDRLHFFPTWPRLDDGGLDELRAWIGNHPDVRLVIVDTLAKVRQAPKPGSLYAQDYDAISGLKEVADEAGIALLLVHHVRKAGADDFTDTVSGTTGLTGAADGMLLIERDRGRPDAVLKVTGRDIEEQEVALKFDASICCWSVLGRADEYRRSDERTAILAVLAQAAPTTMTPKAVAEVMGKRHDAVKKALSRMAQDGEVIRKGMGHYTVEDTDQQSLLSPSHPSHRGHSVTPTDGDGDAGTPVTPVPGDSEPVLRLLQSELRAEIVDEWDGAS